MEKFDDILMQIAGQAGGIEPLFDTLFSWLYRKTDYFHVMKDGDKIGFRAGVAEQLLLRSFRKPKPLRVTESVCESTRIKPRKRSERSEHRWDIRGERGSDGVFVRELQERERHFFRKAVLLTALAAHH